MGYSIIIPARYHSSRLPKKLLLDLSGKPVIQHVYERACQSDAQSVIIAVDHELLARVARNFGAEVIMTASSHISGTDRLHEVVSKQQIDDEHIVVNLQGDEPFVCPHHINLVAKALEEAQDASVSTLAAPLLTVEELFNPSVVKVVLNQDRYALYFSRAPIAWNRDQFAAGVDAKRIHFGQFSEQLPTDLYFRHIGLYAYRVKLLNNFVTWKHCPLEKLECLEQLRVLWNGHKIKVVPVEPDVHAVSGIDTVQDLERARVYLDNLNTNAPERF